MGCVKEGCVKYYDLQGISLIGNISLVGNHLGSDKELQLCLEDGFGT
jgi:hypothetical protein